MCVALERIKITHICYPTFSVIQENGPSLTGFSSFFSLTGHIQDSGPGSVVSSEGLRKETLANSGVIGRIQLLGAIAPRDPFLSDCGPQATLASLPRRPLPNGRLLHQSSQVEKARESVW